MINLDHGTFQSGGTTWEYRWGDDCLRVVPYEHASVSGGIQSADWPTDGLVSVLVGRRVHLLEARESRAGLEAIYGLA